MIVHSSYEVCRDFKRTSEPEFLVTKVIIWWIWMLQRMKYTHKLSMQNRRDDVSNFPLEAERNDAHLARIMQEMELHRFYQQQPPSRGMGKQRSSLTVITEPVTVSRRWVISEQDRWLTLQSTGRLPDEVTSAQSVSVFRQRLTNLHVSYPDLVIWHSLSSLF